MLETKNNLNCKNWDIGTISCHLGLCINCNEFKPKFKSKECPYRESCKTKYKSVVYCCSLKYQKCIEYQVLRITELNRKVKRGSMNAKN